MYIHSVRDLFKATIGLACFQGRELQISGLMLENLGLATNTREQLEWVGGVAAELNPTLEVDQVANCDRVRVHRGRAGTGECDA
jgi:hypothetical protein